MCQEHTVFQEPTGLFGEKNKRIHVKVVSIVCGTYYIQLASVPAMKANKKQ